MERLLDQILYVISRGLLLAAFVVFAFILFTLWDIWQSNKSNEQIEGTGVVPRFWYSLVAFLIILLIYSYFPDGKELTQETQYYSYN